MEKLYTVTTLFILYPKGTNIEIENRLAVSFGWGRLGFYLKGAYTAFLKR